MEDEKLIPKDYFLEEEKTPNEEMPSVKEATPPPAGPPNSYYSQAFPVLEPKPKGSLMKIIIGAIVIVVVGAGTSLAARIWDPMWNPFRPSPEAVINKMVEKMQGIKTSHTDSKLGLNVKNGTEFNVTTTVSADIDISDAKIPKSAMNFNAQIATEGMEFSFGMETRGIGEEAYVKFNTIPVLFSPFLQIAGIDANDLKIQWIKIDKANLLKLSGATSTEAETQTQKEMTDKLIKLFENKKFYLVDKELPDEKINNTETYHYAVSLDKEEIKKVIPETINIILESTGTTTLPQAQLDELQKGINNFFEKAGELSGELWIGKRDYYLYRFYGEKTIDASQLGAMTEGKMTIMLDIGLSKFNQPVTIEAPGQSKKLEDILSPILGQYGQYLGQAQTSAKDAAIITDMGQIIGMAEILYDGNGSYKDLCKNGYLNQGAANYGSDLAKLGNDISDLQGGLLDMKCYSSANSYCVDTDLIESDKGRWCVDSSLASKEIGDSSSCLGKGISSNPYRCPGSATNSSKEGPGLLQASILDNILKMFKK